MDLNAVDNGTEAVTLFPWEKRIRKKLLKSFPIVKTKVIKSLFKNISEEFEKIDWDDKKRVISFYERLKYFYLHFCWKIKWEEECCLEPSCILILYYMSYIALRLSNGRITSQWVNQILLILKTYPGNFYMICDVLLLIKNMKKKYHFVYAEILKFILQDKNLRNPVDAECFIKIMLLFRRFKALSDDLEEADISYLASTIKCPPNTLNWITALKIDTFCDITQENIAEKLIKKYIQSDVMQQLFLALFDNKYDDKILNVSRLYSKHEGRTSSSTAHKESDVQIKSEKGIKNKRNRKQIKKNQHGKPKVEGKSKIRPCESLLQNKTVKKKKRKNKLPHSISQTASESDIYEEKMLNVSNDLHPFSKNVSLAQNLGLNTSGNEITENISLERRYEFCPANTQILDKVFTMGQNNESPSKLKVRKKNKRKSLLETSDVQTPCSQIISTDNELSFEQSNNSLLDIQITDSMESTSKSKKAKRKLGMHESCLVQSNESPSKLKVLKKKQKSLLEASGNETSCSKIISADEELAFVQSNKNNKPVSKASDIQTPCNEIIDANNPLSVIQNNKSLLEIQVTENIESTSKSKKANRKLGVHQSCLNKSQNAFTADLSPVPNHEDLYFSVPDASGSFCMDDTSAQSLHANTNEISKLSVSSTFKRKGAKRKQTTLDEYFSVNSNRKGSCLISTNNKRRKTDIKIRNYLLNESSQNLQCDGNQDASMREESSPELNLSIEKTSSSLTVGGKTSVLASQEEGNREENQTLLLDCKTFPQNLPESFLSDQPLIKKLSMFNEIHDTKENFGLVNHKPKEDNSEKSQSQENNCPSINCSEKVNASSSNDALITPLSLDFGEESFTGLPHCKLSSHLPVSFEPNGNFIFHQSDTDQKSVNSIASSKQHQLPCRVHEETGSVKCNSRNYSKNYNFVQQNEFSGNYPHISYDNTLHVSDIPNDSTCSENNYAKSDHDYPTDDVPKDLNSENDTTFHLLSDMSKSSFGGNPSTENKDSIKIDHSFPSEASNHSLNLDQKENSPSKFEVRENVSVSVFQPCGAVNSDTMSKNDHDCPTVCNNVPKDLNSESDITFHSPSDISENSFEVNTSIENKDSFIKIDHSFPAEALCNSLNLDQKENCPSKFEVSENVSVFQPCGAINSNTMSKNDHGCSTVCNDLPKDLNFESDFTFHLLGDMSENSFEVNTSTENKDSFIKIDHPFPAEASSNSLNLDQKENSPSKFAVSENVSVGVFQPCGAVNSDTMSKNDHDCPTVCNDVPKDLNSESDFTFHLLGDISENSFEVNPSTENEDSFLKIGHSFPAPISSNSLNLDQKEEIPSKFEVSENISANVFQPCGAVNSNTVSQIRDLIVTAQSSCSAKTLDNQNSIHSSPESLDLNNQSCTSVASVKLDILEKSKSIYTSSEDSDKNVSDISISPDIRTSKEKKLDPKHYFPSSDSDSDASYPSVIFQTKKRKSGKVAVSKKFILESGSDTDNEKNVSKQASSVVSNGLHESKINFDTCMNSNIEENTSNKMPENERSQLNVKRKLLFNKTVSKHKGEKKSQNKSLSARTQLESIACPVSSDSNIVGPFENPLFSNEGDNKIQVPIKKSLKIPFRWKQYKSKAIISDSDSSSEQSPPKSSKPKTLNPTDDETSKESTKLAEDIKEELQQYFDKSSADLSLKLQFEEQQKSDKTISGSDDDSSSEQIIQKQNTEKIAIFQNQKASEIDPKLLKSVKVVLEDCYNGQNFLTKLTKRKPKKLQKSKRTISGSDTEEFEESMQSTPISLTSSNHEKIGGNSPFTKQLLLFQDCSANEDLLTNSLFETLRSEKYMHECDSIPGKTLTSPSSPASKKSCADSLPSTVAQSPPRKQKRNSNCTKTATRFSTRLKAGMVKLEEQPLKLSDEVNSCQNDRSRSLSKSSSENCGFESDSTVKNDSESGHILDDSSQNADPESFLDQSAECSELDSESEHTEIESENNSFIVDDESYESDEPNTSSKENQSGHYRSASGNNSACSSINSSPVIQRKSSKVNTKKYLSDSEDSGSQLNNSHSNVLNSSPISSRNSSPELKRKSKGRMRSKKYLLDSDSSESENDLHNGCSNISPNLYIKSSPELKNKSDEEKVKIHAQECNSDEVEDQNSFICISKQCSTNVETDNDSLKKHEVLNQEKNCNEDSFSLFKSSLCELKPQSSSQTTIVDFDCKDSIIDLKSCSNSVNSLKSPPSELKKRDNKSKFSKKSVVESPSHHQITSENLGEALNCKNVSVNDSARSKNSPSILKAWSSIKRMSKSCTAENILPKSDVNESCEQYILTDKQQMLDNGNSLKENVSRTLSNLCESDLKESGTYIDNNSLMCFSQCSTSGMKHDSEINLKCAESFSFSESGSAPEMPLESSIMSNESNDNSTCLVPDSVNDTRKHPLCHPIINRYFSESDSSISNDDIPETVAIVLSKRSDSSKDSSNDIHTDTPKVKSFERKRSWRFNKDKNYLNYSNPKKVLEKEKLISKQACKETSPAPSSDSSEDLPLSKIVEKLKLNVTPTEDVSGVKNNHLIREHISLSQSTVSSKDQQLWEISKKKTLPVSQYSEVSGVGHKSFKDSDCTQKNAVASDSLRDESQLVRPIKVEHCVDSTCQSGENSYESSNPRQSLDKKSTNFEEHEKFCNLESASEISKCIKEFDSSSMTGISKNENHLSVDQDVENNAGHLSFLKQSLTSSLENFSSAKDPAAKKFEDGVENCNQLIKHYSNKKNALNDQIQNNVHRFSPSVQVQTSSQDIFTSVKEFCENQAAIGLQNNTNEIIPPTFRNNNISQNYLAEKDYEMFVQTVMGKLHNDPSSFASEEYLKNSFIDNILDSADDTNMIKPTCLSESTKPLFFNGSNCLSRSSLPSKVLKDNSINVVDKESSNLTCIFPSVSDIDSDDNRMNSVESQEALFKICDVRSLKSPIKINKKTPQINAKTRCITEMNQNGTNSHFGDLDASLKLPQNQGNSSSQFFYEHNNLTCTKQLCENCSSTSTKCDSELNRAAELCENEFVSSCTEICHFANISEKQSCRKMSLESTDSQNLCDLDNQCEKNSKVIFICDVEKKSCKVHLMPDAFLNDILDKSADITKSSRVSANADKCQCVTCCSSSSSKCIRDECNKSISRPTDHNKGNVNTPGGHFFINGVQISTASIFPIVHLGKRCDENTLNSNRADKEELGMSSEKRLDRNPIRTEKKLLKSRGSKKPPSQLRENADAKDKSARSIECHHNKPSYNLRRQRKGQ